MSASALTYPTEGEVRFVRHDGHVLTRLLTVLQHLRDDATVDRKPNTRSLEPDDFDTLRRSLNATYSAGRATQGTHGTAETPSYDWMMALEESRSVEEVIGAAVGRLPSTLMDRIRYLRSYDQGDVHGRDRMSADSLKSAIRSLVVHKMPRPTVVETLAGHVMLEWNVSGDRYLCIEFVAEAQIIYFVFINGQDRVKGRISSGELAERVPLDIVRNWYNGQTK